MEDEIKGLPDADLSPIMDQLKENAKEEQKEEVQKQEERPRNKYGQFTKKDGTLDEDGVLKSYKEIQAAFTRVSQENKATKEQVAQMKEELELSRLNQSYAPPQQQYVPPQQQTYDQQQPDIAVEVQRQVMTTRIAEVLEEEAEKDRTVFQERYAYAQSVSRQYPQLGTTPRGVKKLFELGDKLRTENLKKNAGKALESIFGEPLGEEEITRLRTLVKGDKVVQQSQSRSNAYMPDTSTSTKSGSQTDQKPNYDTKLSEAVEKGDVDGAIEAVFKRQLAE